MEKEIFNKEVNSISTENNEINADYRIGDFKNIGLEEKINVEETAAQSKTGVNKKNPAKKPVSSRTQ